MAPDSFPGCWTCRVRHRKCDLAAPACKECSERRVPCHGYGPKPSWMDGALREQQERAKIKTAVKQNAQRLRKLHIHARQQSSRQNRRNFDQLTEGNEDGERQSTAASAPAASPCSSLVYEPAISHGSELPDSEQNRTSNLALGIDASRATLPSASITPHESALLMHYLDQVFYWQFPYFCSLSKLGNRGWLFRLLSNRGPLYHAALSLSALHQSAICGREIDYLQNQKAYEYHSSALRNLCEFLSQERSGQLLGDETLLSEFLACGTMLISFEVRY